MTIRLEIEIEGEILQVRDTNATMTWSQVYPGRVFRTQDVPFTYDELRGLGNGKHLVNLKTRSWKTAGRGVSPATIRSCHLRQMSSRSPRCAEFPANKKSPRRLARGFFYSSFAAATDPTVPLSPLLELSCELCQPLNNHN